MEICLYNVIKTNKNTLRNIIANIIENDILCSHPM